MIEILIIEEYDFRGTPFVTHIFWNFNLKSLFCPKWRPIFEDFYSTERKIQNFFKWLVVGFGPKGMPGAMWDIVR